MKLILFSLLLAVNTVAQAEIAPPPRVAARECGGAPLVSIWATFGQDSVSCDVGGVCPVWLGWGFQCSTDLSHWAVADFAISVAGSRDIYIVVPRNLKTRMFFRAYHP